MIEIEGYEPSVSMVGAGDLIEPPIALSANSSTKRARNSVNTDSYLANEFCRFYKIQPLIEKGQSLIYFSEPIRQSLKLEPTSKCTSCLFIYLYHSVHLRADFYFIKDHLPSCFNNLHYNENLFFKSIKNQSRKLSALKEIEESFRHYWSKLRCEAVSGSLDLGGKESMGRWCGRSKEASEIIQSNDVQICSKSILNSTKPQEQKKPILNQQSSKKRTHIPKVHSHHSFKWALFVGLMCSSILVFSVFLLVKYSNWPCFNANNKFRRLDNSAAVSFNNGGDVEAYDGYEYDEDFELSKKEAESDQSVEAHENLEMEEKGAVGRIKNLFSKEKIKNGLLSLQNKNGSIKYPYYSYNSTESTLVQTGVRNEFECKKTDVEKQMSSDDEARAHSVVTYDINKQKARPNLLMKINAQFFVNEASNETIKEKVLRLSRNPFEVMEEAESLKKNEDRESVA